MIDDINKEDELIDVKLPRKDFEIMREMIKKQEALSWLGRYARNVLLVFAGGVITLITFWENISSFFQSLIK